MYYNVTIIALLIGFYSGEVPLNHNSEHKKDLDPYINYIRISTQTPVEYILSKFKKSDIVILCERHHDEFTQYELILNLISDKRFIKEVGHVFTEIGSSTNNHNLAKLLSSTYSTDRQIEDSVLNLYRDLSYYPLWEKYCFYYFLLNITKLNNSLNEEDKINIYFTDLAFSWIGMNKEKYTIFRKSLSERDKYMAQQIIRIFNRIKMSNESRKKALVIMNYRHAFNDYNYDDGRNRDNVGRYLFEEYDDSVSNIMLNSLAIKKYSTDALIFFRLIKDGKWDAAFEVAGNPNLGFDFINSPFGEDSFDYYPIRNSGVKYKHIFTGYIFYKPINEHKRIWGIPNISKDGFGEILINRYKITGTLIDESYKEQFASERGNLREFKYENIDSLLVQRNYWFNDNSN
jgi:hypothetical protein